MMGWENLGKTALIDSIVTKLPKIHTSVLSTLWSQPYLASDSKKHRICVDFNQ